MFTKKKRIVLFNPKFERHPQLILPFALLFISRFLHQDFDIDIFISSPKEDITEKLLSKCRDAICVGFTCLTGINILESLQIAKEVRKKFPHIPLIWGGWHPTIMADQTLNHELVDYIVRGQGEITFKELIWSLVENKDISNIQGLSYKKDGKKYHNPARDLADIKTFPPIPYHLVDVERFIYSGTEYLEFPGFGERTIDYISSVGCPNNCQFCSTPVTYRRRWYGNSVDNILRDFKFLITNYGIDSILFRDDNVFVDKRRILLLCERLLENNISLNFGYVDATVKPLLKLSDDDWALLKKAGFKQFYIGAESGDNETLNLMNKNTTVEEYIAVAEKCAKYNLGIVFSFLIGTPFKNKTLSPNGVYEDIKNNLSLMRLIDKKNKNCGFCQGFYTPYPGNKLYFLSKEAGFQEPKNFEEWAILSSRRKCFVDMPIKLMKFAESIEHVLIYRLKRPRMKIKNIKALIKYPLRLLATIRFRLNLYQFPIEMWLLRLYSKFKGQKYYSWGE